MNDINNKYLKKLKHLKNKSYNSFYHTEDGKIFQISPEGKIYREVPHHLPHEEHLNKNEKIEPKPIIQKEPTQKEPTQKEPTQKEPTHEIIKKLPNSNWKQWAQKNLKENPKGLTKKTVEYLEHFSGMQHIPDVKNARFESHHNWETGIQHLQEQEKKYIDKTKNNKNFVSMPKTAKKIIDFGDGYAWYSLGKPACKAEGKAMGHCGNVPSKKPDHDILSLRKEHILGKQKYYEPHLTFINDTKTNTLGEMKGRANNKPSPKYHKHITELLKKGYTPLGGGYASDSNFHPDDLSEEHVKEVFQNNPIGLFGHKNHELWANDAVKHSDKNVRWAVAKHPNVSPEILHNLHKDPDEDVRWAVVERPNVSPEILHNLHKDPNKGICRAVAKHPNVSPETLHNLHKDPDEDVRRAVAEHPNISPEILHNLHKDPNKYVRWAVAEHPNVSPEILHNLHKDPDEYVRAAVTEHPKYQEYLKNQNNMKKSEEEIPNSNDWNQILDNLNTELDSGNFKNSRDNESLVNFHNHISNEEHIEKLTPEYADKITKIFDKLKKQEDISPDSLLNIHKKIFSYDSRSENEKKAKSNILKHAIKNNYNDFIHTNFFTYLLSENITDHVDVKDIPEIDNHIMEKLNNENIGKDEQWHNQSLLNKIVNDRRITSKPLKDRRLVFHNYIKNNINKIANGYLKLSDRSSTHHLLENKEYSEDVNPDQVLDGLSTNRLLDIIHQGKKLNNHFNTLIKPDIEKKYYHKIINDYIENPSKEHGYYHLNRVLKDIDKEEYIPEKVLDILHNKNNDPKFFPEQLAELQWKYLHNPNIDHNKQKELWDNILQNDHSHFEEFLKENNIHEDKGILTLDDVDENQISDEERDRIYENADDDMRNNDEFEQWLRNNSDKIAHENKHNYLDEIDEHPLDLLGDKITNYNYPENLTDSEEIYQYLLNDPDQKDIFQKDIDKAIDDKAFEIAEEKIKDGEIEGLYDDWHESDDYAHSYNEYYQEHLKNWKKEKLHDLKNQAYDGDFLKDPRWIPDHLKQYYDVDGQLSELHKTKEEKSGIGKKYFNNPIYTHEYGEGQHFFEMAKDYADHNNGYIDIGTLNKLHPESKEDWKKIFGDKGKISSDEIQSKIDQIPKDKYHVSYGEWSSGLQSIDKKPQAVVRLDHSSSSVKPMQADKELYNTFKHIQDVSKKSGHPTNSNTIGWMRVNTHNHPKKYFMDELQSDFSSTVRKYLKNNNKHDKAQHVEQIEGHHKNWREAMLNLLTKIGKQSGAEQIYTHSPESKANHTGAQKTHSVYHDSYHKVPRKVGFKPVLPTDLPIGRKGLEHFIPKTDLTNEDINHHEEAATHHKFLENHYNTIINEQPNHPNLEKWKTASEKHGKIGNIHELKLNRVNQESRPVNNIDSHINNIQNKLPEYASKIEQGVHIDHPHDEKIKDTIHAHVYNLKPSFIRKSIIIAQDLIKKEQDMIFFKNENFNINNGKYLKKLQYLNNATFKNTIL